jgi:nucleoside-diphosphate-sugar epimerase
LAWQETRSSNYQYSKENHIWSDATIEFIDESIKDKIWFINAGSASESSQHELRYSPYGKAKSAIREFLLSKCSFECASQLDIQYVFSLDDKQPRVLKSYLESKLTDSFFLVNPEKKHDFIHVKDVAIGIKNIIENKIIGEIYLGSGRLRTVRELIFAASRFTDEKFFSINETEKLKSNNPLNNLLKNGWYPNETERYFKKIC